MSDDTQTSSPAAPEPFLEARPRRRSRLGRAGIVTAASALALGGIVAGVAVTDASPEVATAAESATVESDVDADAPTLLDDAYAAPGPADRQPGAMPAGGGAQPGAGTAGDDASSGAAASTQEEAAAADDDESAGIVLIDTVLGYASSEAAGTGMVLTSDGLVLTNHHVIEDSTEITVTVGTTGETYTATVVGVDAEDDVALLQLDDATELTTIAIDDDGVTAGDDVTAVGNAEGGGVLMAADGSVTALESSVTTSASFTTTSSTLDGMIEFAADVVSGDSGGALLDEEGEVIGMTTAASTGTATIVAFAIPIEDALAIAAQIQAGDESDGAVIGYPAFLGIALESSDAAVRPGASAGAADDDGAQIAYVYDGTPAAEAGLEAGDTITAVDGTAVADGDDLSAIVQAHEPGDSITLTWTDGAGATESATLTLIAGPSA